MNDEYIITPFYLELKFSVLTFPVFSKDLGRVSCHKQLHNTSGKFRVRNKKAEYFT